MLFLYLNKYDNLNSAITFHVAGIYIRDCCCCFLIYFGSLLVGAIVVVVVRVFQTILRRRLWPYVGIVEEGTEKVEIQ